MPSRCFPGCEHRFDEIRADEVPFGVNLAAGPLAPRAHRLPGWVIVSAL